MKRLTAILISAALILIAARCEEENSCDYKGCDPRRQTIKVAQNAIGRVAILSAQHPDVWVIVSEDGIIGENSVVFDGPDIVIACNLPDSMKKDGLKVIFSGELKDSCNDYNSFTSIIYYSSTENIQIHKDL